MSWLRLKGKINAAVLNEEHDHRAGIEGIRDVRRDSDVLRRDRAATHTLAHARSR